MADLCLLFAGLLVAVGLAFAILFAYCWWADYDPLLLGETDMAQLTATQTTQAKADLKKAGCPDDCVERLVSAGTPWSVIQAILAFIASHPQIATDFWALLQTLLSGGVIPPAPTA